VEETEDAEVQSPLTKQPELTADGRRTEGGTGKKLFAQETEVIKPQQMRKSKVTGTGTQTPDLNVPLMGSSAIVPVGLVNSMVNQLDGGSESSGGSMIETLKKQRRISNQHARSAVAANDSPRWAQ
jgi:hypothetical protein